MILKSLLVLVLIQNLFGFNLVLDIGHTPSKTGAKSFTCEQEYSYNRNLSLYLLSSLKNINNINTSLSSEYDRQNITFEERYQSSIGKNLFLSIHHDSVQEQYLHFNANGCPSSDHASGFSMFISRKNPDFLQSLSYAKKLGQALVGEGLHPSLHHSEKIEGENRELLDKKLGIYIFDDLKVLKNAKCPAILLEAGVIVNPSDEELVKSDNFKEKITNAIKKISE